MRKLETYKRLILLVLSGVCLLLETGIFYYFWKTNFSPSITQVTGVEYYFRAELLEIAFYGLILYFLSHMYGGMRIGYLKNAEVVFSQAFATLATNVLIYAELSILAKRLFVLNMFLLMTVLQVLIAIIWNNVAYWIYKSIFPPRKMLLIHGDRPIEGILSKFSSRKDKYDIVKCMHVSEGMEKLQKEIMSGYEGGEYHAVVIWDVHTQERNAIMKFCYAKSIRTYMMPKITDVIVLGAEELHLFDTPILLTREYSLTMEQRFVKRMIDIICSAILLVITSPIMLVTAIAIKAYDKGPVLYKQVRCTKDQKEFEIMKFRSMRTDAEKDGVARLAKKDDDRITPIGKFIRKCRIDELPQLINILRGDMSFIGPRPERPSIIKDYMEVMPEFAYRMKVKAGLAGYAQVYGKYNTTPYDKLKLDLTYIENYSLWLDLQLMLLTLKILFWPDSTEGVENEQITALKEEMKRIEKDN
ncbi:MAG: exopolysaccharide biosynthesis polyprenyl glycosylphosphotransferase [Lachnospiraceae bacterium]|nr:exopolysaccharide biosynthesis polyprenyl glycosylphosphotransferase [Lachnospiraceae bacterium]